MCTKPRRTLMSKLRYSPEDPAEKIHVNFGWLFLPPPPCGLLAVPFLFPSLFPCDCLHICRHKYCIMFWRCFAGKRGPGALFYKSNFSPKKFASLFYMDKISYIYAPYRGYEWVLFFIAGCLLFRNLLLAFNQSCALM